MSRILQLAVRPSRTDGSSYNLDEKDVSEVRNELDVLSKEFDAARSMSFYSEHQAEQYYSKIYRHFQLWNEILSRPEYEGMNRLCEFNEEFQRKVDAIDEQSRATVVIGDHAPNCSSQARKCHQLPLYRSRPTTRSLDFFE
jgi:hypothetical protein